MAAYEYDLGILGGGAAGLTAAAGAAQFGAKTILVEKAKKLGGDCLHFGCVPSKTLIRTAGVWSLARRAKEFGLPEVALPPVSLAAVMGRVRSVIDTIQEHDSPERFCKLGAEVRFGSPRFVDDHTVDLDGARLTARAWIVATGSSPSLPPVEGIAEVPYWTNETVFSQTELPGHLLILGGGPIGVEMAQAFRRLGSDVTVIEYRGPGSRPRGPGHRLDPPEPPGSRGGEGPHRHEGPQGDRGERVGAAAGGAGEGGRGAVDGRGGRPPRGGRAETERGGAGAFRGGRRVLFPRGSGRPADADERSAHLFVRGRERRLPVHPRGGVRGGDRPVERGAPVAAEGGLHEGPVVHVHRSRGGEHRAEREAGEGGGGGIPDPRGGVSRSGPRPRRRGDRREDQGADHALPGRSWAARSPGITPGN